MEIINILKGDAFPLKITISANGATLTNEDLKEVSVTVNNVTKNWPGEIEYYKGAFYFPITQKDSFRFEEGPADITVRPLFNSDNVIGKALYQSIFITDSANTDILDGKEN